MIRYFTYLWTGQGWMQDVLSSDIDVTEKEILKVGLCGNKETTTKLN